AAAPVAAPSAARAPAAQDGGDPAARRPAGFWKRVLATLVDYVVIIVISLIAGLGLGVGLALSGLSETAIQWVANLFGLALGIAYYAVLESSSWQGTLGKYVVGIVVTDGEGRRISLLRAIGRYFAKFLSVIPLLGGFLMAAFTRRKQALHDYVAGTLVLNRRADAGDLPVWAIVLLLIPALMVPVGGILLAIAIPAYQDYTVRAQVAGALASAAGAKVAIAEYALTNRALPDSLEAAGASALVPGGTLELRDGVLVLTVAAPGTQADGTTLAIEPYQSADGNIAWRCGGSPPPAGASDIAEGDSQILSSLDSRFRPASCR
ncbi:MAG: RDD family protein, partial [Xanthomonadaceae bacterium]|nr:RDD family protein [Xanthomonadaceae bacterium]